jgi:hypothetical protein
MLQYVLVLLPHEYVSVNENSGIHQSAIFTTVRYELRPLATTSSAYCRPLLLTTNLHIQHTVPCIYRVIHKSLRDFRPLRYSNRDGNAEGEHVNRGRGTPSFCPTLQVLDMSTLGDAADVKFGNFGKFQDTERVFIPCPRHVSSRLPPSDKTCK